MAHNLNEATAETAAMYMGFIRKLPHLSKYAVNIGASDGVEQDIMVDLYRAGWAGLAIEPREQQYGMLCNNLPAAVTKLCCGVTPENVVRIFREQGVPTDLDAVDIDIDGYDIDVAAALLAEYKPSIVSMEINEDIPPGITFGVHYHPNHTDWTGGPFFGCSLDMVTQTLGSLGYRLLCVDWHNTIFVHERHAHLFNCQTNNLEAWIAGYWSKPNKEAIYYWKKWDDMHYGRSVGEIMDRLTAVFAGHDPGTFTLRPT